MRRRLATAALAALLVAAVGPAAAEPDEDGQPSDAPSRYDASSPTGWMTSAGTDRVLDIAQIGDTVYVAGSFTGIRPSRTGPITNRPWLAAFDAATGAPRTAFAPALNGAVHALEPAPDGSRLYVAGAFTSVNGATRNRLVALDPVTGATSPGFAPNIGGGTVRSIVLRGSTLWLGGSFASASGQTRTRLAAVDTTTGLPLPSWIPTAGDTVFTLEMAPGGGRLYVGGRFPSISGRPTTAYLAAVDPVSGQPDATFTAQPGREVFDVLADDRGLVWTALGGSLGRADVYRAADGSLLTRHETAGDVQSVEEVGDLVYFGGHDIGHSEREHLGVVDPAAPAILETVTFDSPTTGGLGTWALHGTGRDLWVGGEYTNPFFGFARFPAEPDPPARTELVPVLSPWRYLDTAAAPDGWRTPGFGDGAWPTGSAELGFGDGGEATILRSGRGTYYFRRTFSVTDRSSLSDLRLDLLADDGAAVFLNGTEVARTNLPDGALGDGSRALVGLSGNPEDTFLPFSIPTSALVEGQNTIAVEVHQNAAASSDLSFDARLSAVRAGPPDPPPGGPVELVEPGATWRYRDDGWDGGDGSWRDLGFDDAGWAQGPSELGREDGDEATVVGGRWTTTHWFRRTFTVDGASAVRDLRLELLADDGAVAHLNGVEVARDNMPAGPITSATNAVDYRVGLGESVWRPFPVSAGALREGQNVLAVEVHQAWGSPDVSFNARLAGTISDEVDDQAPTTPTGLTSPGRTATSVDLAWSASSDDTAVDHYDVFVDGAFAGTTTGTTFTARGLTGATTYDLAVEAVDGAGNRSDRSTSLAVTTAAPAPDPVTVIGRGATWRYRDVGPPPPSSWATPGFDDASWAAGPAVLGREEGDEATVLAPGTGARWFRRTFTLPDAGAVTDLRLELVADDGALVLLNGAEVVRDNLPTGPVTPDTLAPAYRTGAAERAVRTFTVPTAALVDGTNVLAVQLHQAWGSPDASFDAALTATGAPADTTPPSVPTGLTAPARTATTIDLTWAPSTDAGTVDHYEVVRDGTVVATVPGTTATLTGLTPATTYSIQVAAVDAAGNRSARSPALAVTTSAPPPGPSELIPLGATWRYRDTGPEPPSTWNQPGFDDSAWSSGPAELGREDGDEATVLTPGTGARWFRHAFTVADAGTAASLVLDLLADDGAVVYLNGVELARDNLPAGPITASTLATDYRFGVAETQRRTFTLPATALVDGANVLAVRLHQASGSTDASFDLRLRTT